MLGPITRRIWSWYIAAFVTALGASAAQGATGQKVEDGLVLEVDRQDYRQGDFAVMRVRFREKGLKIQLDETGTDFFYVVLEAEMGRIIGQKLAHQQFVERRTPDGAGPHRWVWESDPMVWRQRVVRIQDVPPGVYKLRLAYATDPKKLDALVRQAVAPPKDWGQARISECTIPKLKDVYDGALLSNPLTIRGGGGAAQPVRKAKKPRILYGYVSAQGNVVYPGALEDARPFSGGLAAVKKEGKWGFMDERGKTVIKPQYAEVGDFYDGLARVRIGQCWGYVDRGGKLVIPAVYFGATDYHDGMASYRWEHAQVLGVLDTRGESVEKVAVDQLRPFSQGLAAVRFYPSGRWGYIDKRGKSAIRGEWDFADSFPGPGGPALVGIVNDKNKEE